jgi:hypothetical protein
MATEAARFQPKNNLTGKEKNTNHLDTNRPSNGRTYGYTILLTMKDWVN